MYEYIKILLGTHPILHISRIRVNENCMCEDEGIRKVKRKRCAKLVVFSSR
jgi:hypothetical protein